MIALSSGVTSKSIVKCNPDLFHECVLVGFCGIRREDFAWFCTLANYNSHSQRELQKSCPRFVLILKMWAQKHNTKNIKTSRTTVWLLFFFYQHWSNVSSWCGEGWKWVVGWKQEDLSTFFLKWIHCSTFLLPICA